MRKMSERGYTGEEAYKTVESGVKYEVDPPALGRSMVFTDGYLWRGTWYPHKELRVIYVIEDNVYKVITVIVRYGYWEE